MFISFLLWGLSPHQICIAFPTEQYFALVDVELCISEDQPMGRIGSAYFINKPVSHIMLGNLLTTE
jgi:hypothetical protein